jgi:hypothetical protein
METSLVLAVQPALVTLENRVPKGHIGIPHLAKLHKGEHIPNAPPHTYARDLRRILGFDPERDI